MDEEKLQKFADHLEADSERLVDRWQGRPDLIMDDLFRIRDIDSGQWRDLELFDVQREFVHAYFYSDASVINAYKGRRIGYSYIVLLCFVLEGLLYPDSFYPLVSRSFGQSKDRISDIEAIIDGAKIPIPTTKTNTDYIELWNDTGFMAYSSESDTSRGADSARAVLMDEMAFIENEEDALRAFNAFLALGEDRKMIQVSTPNTRNDRFMKEHRRGSPTGENGIVSIKQPTFANADEIDPNISLMEQDLEPVRPEVNVQQIETERLSDPEGFAQEYLCTPVVDEYAFFDPDSIDRAMERAEGEEHGLGRRAAKPNGAQRIMGMDIGISRDDTVLSVVDHLNGRRYHREMIVADDRTLREEGIPNPDRGNANDIARLVAKVKGEMNVDTVVMDKGGVGQTFENIINRKLGREVVGVSFRDKGAISDAFEDMNVGLHEDDVTLYPSDRLRDELTAMMKEKRDQYAKPKFSGKDNSESGKDDTAMATVLACFPPHGDTEPGGIASKERESEEQGVRVTEPATNDDDSVNGNYNPSYGATSVNRSTRTRNNKYKARRRR